jgi:NADH pyrophosphatase NudC (nudix superfamily)
MKDWLYCPKCNATLLHLGDERNPYVECNKCGFVKYNNPIPTTVAIIYNKQEKQFLFVRRAIEPQKGKWDTVGGFLEPGETAEECLFREVKEETGCELSSIQILGTHISVYGETGLSTLGVSFLCRLNGASINLAKEENSEFRWFAPSEQVTLAFKDGQEAYALAKSKLGIS